MRPKSPAPHRDSLEAEITHHGAALRAGAVVTTRYYGGYERVDILSIEDGYFVVLRFSGQATDYLPKDQIEKVLRDGPEPSRH